MSADNARTVVLASEVEAMIEAARTDEREQAAQRAGQVPLTSNTAVVVQQILAAIRGGEQAP